MMRAHLRPWPFLLLLVLSVYSQGQDNAGIIPLAIRSPYFGIWLDNSNVGKWPLFWTGSTIGWQGMIRVDKKAYQWLGDSSLGTPKANITNAPQLTPTQTILSMQAGPVDIVVTFLSPIETTDATKQSIPLSYVSLDVKARDGQSHNVQVYCDISAEFVTPNTQDIVTWSSTTTGSSSFHQIRLQSNQSLVEIDNRAQDLTVVIATQSNPEVSTRIANDTDCRGQFSQDGILSGTPPVQSAPMGNPYPVFSISRDLGNITETSSPIAWTVGGLRNPTTSFTDSNGNSHQRAPLYVTSYSDISSVVDAFVVDFAAAKARADKLDEQILGAASNVSSTYASLVSLAARIAIGGTELTVGIGSDGKWNMSDVKMFMKDVGSSGRVNPVETIYASFPFFLYINPTFAGQLLAPLLEYQDSFQYTQPYAARDLGLNYPSGTGNNGIHGQGYEQSGNMLIMALAHARASGDGSLINQHYQLLKKWTDYLVSFNVTPPDLLTVDQEMQNNSTNLAIKGIIGIKAMSEISKVLNRNNDSEHYAGLAAAFASTWKSLATSSDGQHLLADYGGSSSWAQIYNLYWDRQLQTSLVDDQIYASQTQYYDSLISGSSSPFGLPIDSSTSIANAAWTLFTAATTTDSAVRDALIGPVWTHAVQVPKAFRIQYKVDSIDPLPTGGVSNPAAGAMFAPLALSLSSQNIVVPPAASSSNKTSTPIGAIVGGVIGGIALIGLIVGVGSFVWWRRRRQQRHYDKNLEYIDAQPFEPEQGPTVMSYRDLTLSSIHLPTSGQANDTQGSPVVPLTTQHVSSKAREAMMTNSYHTTPPTSSYSSGATSSREPPTDVGSPVTTSPSDVQGLRMEVENLRRVMQEIQADRVEAPPSYTG